MGVIKPYHGCGYTALTSVDTPYYGCGYTVLMSVEKLYHGCGYTVPMSVEKLYHECGKTVSWVWIHCSYERARQFGQLFVTHLTKCASHSPVLVTIAEIKFEPTKNIFWFLEGRPLNITCTANAKSESARLTIEKTGTGNPGKFQSNKAKEKLSDGTFKLTNTITVPSASRGDADSYLCTLHPGDSEFQSNGETVLQTYELFTVYTQGANVTEGQETQIRCEPHVAEEIFIGWYKDREPLMSVPDLKGRVTISNDNKTVTFKEAKPSDGGAYTCRIEFYQNLNEMIFDEQVYLQAKPYILPEALTNVTNTSIVLTCPVGGYPPPEVFWQRGKDVLTSKGNVQMTTVGGQRVAQLVITNASDVDFGTYTCIADNWLGKAEFSYQVNTGLRSDAIAGPGSGIGARVFLCLAVFWLIHITLT
ncbi:hypothetical protein Btru_027068 [Bulinus truncatus]|nr:hypothetical protein Btru_027068 [Bulinus truncatus]